MKRTPAERRLLARLRLVRMDMRREGKLLLTGYRVTSSAHTDVARTWARYDYTPPSMREPA